MTNVSQRSTHHAILFMRRTHVTLFRQALKTVVLMAFLPPSIFTSFRHFPLPKPLTTFIFTLIKLCSLLDFTAHGFRLISYHQPFSALVNLTGPAFLAYTISNHPTLLGIETEQQEMCTYIGHVLGEFLLRSSPLSVGSKTAGPFPGPAPCFLVYSWALCTFGCILPMVIGNFLEERLRIQFAERKRHYIPSPALGWSLAHCFLQVIVGAHMVWVLISAITTFFT